MREERRPLVFHNSDTSFSFSRPTSTSTLLLLKAHFDALFVGGYPFQPVPERQAMSDDLLVYMGII